MEQTRRSFLRGVSAAAVAGVGGPAAARQPAVRVRKDVSTLNANSPDIVALKTAVDRMKQNVDKAGAALPAGDGRRWQAQADIHGTFAGGFGACQHGNWFFLPWHRIYLYHFEEIVREQSGNEDFALPYWDWSRARTLPGLFWGRGNPLDNPARNNVTGSGRLGTDGTGLTPQSRIEDGDFNRTFSPTVISRILATSDFETFGGGEVAQPGDRAFQGTLEGGPHNRGHTWVGGDMRTGGSPYDPIFWLHHCNVDRLWTEWARRDGHNPPGNLAWLGTSFAEFYGRNGSRVPAADRIKVERTLNTRGLGYEYDRRKDEKVGAKAGRPEAVQVFGTLTTRDAARLDRAAVAFAPVATREFAGLVNRAVDTPLDMRSVRLRIGGVKPPDDPATTLDVFLNCEKLTGDTPISDKSYVGSCTFLEGGKDGHADKAGVAFALSLNSDLARLYGDRPLQADERLQVGIVSRRPADGGRRFETVGIEPINPTRVTIEVVGPKA